ncbi:MAG: hypothetical protein GY757_13405, partial [bacterium]|nr:hypothetical protein [bacterium]
MHELSKDIGGKKYEVFGPNAIMLKWARHSDLAQSVYGRSGLTEDTLFRTLCPINPDDRQIHSKKAIQSLWLAYPELGPYPFLDTLSDFEFNRQFFPAYREHVIHQLRVFMTGLYLFDLCKPIRAKIIEETGCSSDKEGEAEFVRRWTACAISHDIGYVLENEGGNEPDGKAWLKTRDVLNRSLAAPLFSIFGKEKIPEHVEQKIIDDKEIHRLKINYQRKLEFDKDDADILDLIAGFGTISGLGNSDVPGKSPLRSYYDYAFSHDSATSPRPRFRDHGIVSALLLLRLWTDFRKYFDKLMPYKDNPLLGNIFGDLAAIQNRMPECEKSIIAAAGAIALHNIDPSLWNHGDALSNGLTLHSFEIGLGSKTSLAFLLGLADTLQDWDRPRFRAVKESNMPILDQRDMHFCSVNNKIRLYFKVDDETYKNPENTSESRFFKMKKDLKAYLDHQAIDELLEWGECDTQPDPVVQNENPEPVVTHEPQDPPQVKETRTVNNEQTEPGNLDDLIYII